MIACGAGSATVAAARGVELPIRPLVRQLADVGPVDGVPAGLPMTIEENGFHFRRVGDDVLRLAMGEPSPRWDGPDDVLEELVEDWRERLAFRYPRAAGAPVRRAWAGFYDMTPDAHPIIGAVADGVYSACGFSGHGFMQSPAVGDAVAAELLGDTPPFELAPYRLDRFAEGAIFPETLVLLAAPGEHEHADRRHRGEPDHDGVDDERDRDQPRTAVRRRRPPPDAASSSPSVPQPILPASARVMNWFRLTPRARPCAPARHGARRASAAAGGHSGPASSHAWSAPLRRARRS